MENESVLIIGGGIAGIQASLDLANRGFQIYLVEKSPSLGGRMAQLDKTFPTMDCSMCILAPKMIECGHHPNVKLLTYSEVKEVKGSVGNFEVKVLKRPRFIDESKCTGCGICSEKCPIKVPNEFDMGLGMRKAVYMPFPQAVPRIATIDEDNCLLLRKGVCEICQKFCQAGAVDFNQQPEEIALNVGAIIVATGFDMFNPEQIPPFGYKGYKDVITAMELERLLCASGPTGGQLVRPSDGKKPVLIKEHDPNAMITIFYIDMRAFGRGFQEFVNRAKSEYGINFTRSNPGEITEDPETKRLTIWFEDNVTRTVKKLNFDLVVLCTALVPRRDSDELAKILGIETDDYRFFKSADSVARAVDTTVQGIFACGYCLGPKTGDIPDSVTQASAAAARVAEVFAEVTK